MIKCKKCNIEKEDCKFYKRSSGYIYKVCDQCKATSLRDYYGNNKDKFNRDNLKHSKKYYQNHSAKIKLRNKNKRLADPDAAKKQDAKFYQNNIIGRRAAVKKWKISNPEKARNHCRIRRARKKNAIIEFFTTEQLIKKYGNNCFYCLNGSFEHLDHYIPLSKGGSHTLENVRPSCQKCNNKKYNKLPTEFVEHKP